MAANRAFARGEQVSLTPTSTLTDPAKSGEPLVVGQLPGVALKDATDTIANSGKTTVSMVGVFKLSVKGIDGGGNSAVAVGDLLYYVAADTPRISKKATGIRFGYALEPVLSGATTTIKVKVGY